jgi:hypothetical protein
MPDVAPLSTFLMLAISFCGTFGGIPMLTPETLAHRIRFPLMEKVAWSRRFDSFSTKMSQIAVNMYGLAENCRNSWGGCLTLIRRKWKLPIWLPGASVSSLRPTTLWLCAA